MIKDPKQLESHAEYKSAAAAAAKAVDAKPVRFLCFPRFPFGKENLPAMLIGDLPSAVVTVAKKKGGAFISGRVRVNNQQMDVEVTSGKFDGNLFSITLKTLGVALPVAQGKMEADDQPQGLKEKAVGAEYKDEDKKAGWRTDHPIHKESDKVTTKYFNAQEKEASKVEFDDEGNMLDAVGNKIKGKEVGFVMDPKNAQVHQFDPSSATSSGGKEQRNHHSSPLSGGNVAGAGMIKPTPQGRIDTIKDQSGHYKPDATYTHQVVNELGKDKDAEGFSKNLVDRSPDANGNPINKPAKVELMGKGGLSEEEFATVQGDVDKINDLIARKFGENARLDLRPSFPLKYINILIGQKTSLTLTTQQFEQTHGNEDAIRAKKSTMDELRANEEAKAAKAAAAASARASSPQRMPDAYSQPPVKPARPESAYAPPVPNEKSTKPAAASVPAGSPQRIPGAYSGSTAEPARPESAYAGKTPAKKSE